MPPKMTNGQGEGPPNTLGSKLRRMLDPITSSKNATFHATIVIHDLVNVPLISGDFAVRWKFRGREGSRGLESEAPTPQGSSGMPSVNPSQTSLPISGPGPPSPASSSTSSTSTVALTIPSVPNVNSPTPTNAPPKSLSLPPPPLPGHRQLKKKASDPTPATSSPLARSFATGDTAVAAPVMTSSPLEEVVDPVDNLESTLDMMDQDVIRSSPPTSINLSYGDDDAEHKNGVPFPRSKQDAANSETSAASISSASTAQTNEGSLTRPPRRLPHLSLPSHLHRHSSHPNLRSASTASAASVASSTNTSPPRSFSLHKNRSRTSLNSNGSASTPKPEPTSSDHRKGHTPIRSLKSHCCTWDFRLDQQLRIVVGRLGMSTDVSDGITARDYHNPYSTPNVFSTDRFRSKPLLGAGPGSASTIKLSVEQIVRHRQRQAQPSEVGKREQAASHVTTRSLFGNLDLDLAAFAEKGVVTRRYLLKGSKSNATIKLSIEVKWLSGEENWVAPDIKEGLHVARLVPLTQESVDHLGADLRLTRSNTNSSVSSLSTMTQQNQSSSSIQLPMSRQPSNSSIPGGLYPSFQGSSVDLLSLPSTATYKSVDQHLKKREKDEDAASIKSAKSSKSIPSDVDGHQEHKKPRDRIKDQLSKLRQPSPSPDHRSSSPHRHRHHTHHIHHLPVNINRGPTHLPPDYAVEAIFNPVPGLADSPFTYAAKGGINSDEVSQASLAENLKQVVMADDEQDASVRKSSHEEERSHKLGWGRMRNRITKDKELAQRMMASRTVSGQSQSQ